MNIIVYPLWTRVRGVDPTWKTLGCKGTSTISHCIFVCTHRRNHTSDRFERPSAVGRCSESSTVCNYSSNCNEKGKSWANKTHINKQICMMHVYIHVSNSQLYDEDDLKNLWLISCVGVCFIVQWRLILKKKKDHGSEVFRACRCFLGDGDFGFPLTFGTQTGDFFCMNIMQCLKT